MRILLVISLGLLLAHVGRAEAQDVWSDDFPGVHRLHRETPDQSVHAVKVDLCQAGISIHATGSGESRRTVPSFGQLTGVQVAVNGDFFTGSGSDGLALSGGDHWAGTDHGYTAPLGFGDHRVELPRHDDTAGVQP